MGAGKVFGKLSIKVSPSCLDGERTCLAAKVQNLHFGNYDWSFELMLGASELKVRKVSHIEAEKLLFILFILF